MRLSLLNTFSQRKSKVCAIGDSTVAANYPPGIGIQSVPSYLLPKLPFGSTITDLSFPGDTIQDQLDAWNALSAPTRAAFNSIEAEIGLNDTDPAEAVAVTMARYQTMVDAFRADNATAKIVLATMLPCKGRWPAVFPGNETAAQQKWEDMNDAIMGIGPNAITGVDHRFNGHTIALDDGSGFLNPIYDTGDGIHENNAARQIIAGHWRNGLRAVGF